LEENNTDTLCTLLRVAIQDGQQFEMVWDGLR
jgi:hypothetical protein